MVTLIRYANEGFKNYKQENGITGCYVFIRKSKGQALRYDKHLYPELQDKARNKDTKHTLKVSDDTEIYARQLPRLFLSDDGLSVRMDCDNEELKKRPLVKQRVKDIANWQIQYEKLIKTIQENSESIRRSGGRGFAFSMLVEEYLVYEGIYEVK